MVPFKRIFLEVVQQLSAAACHGDQAAAGMEVLLIGRQVRGQVGYARAQYCNLDFARTGVLVVQAVFVDYCLFVY